MSNEFLDAINDKKIVNKAMVHSFVDNNVVTKEGQSYFFGDVNLGTFKEFVDSIGKSEFDKQLGVLKTVLSEKKKLYKP